MHAKVRKQVPRRRLEQDGMGDEKQSEESRDGRTCLPRYSLGSRNSQSVTEMGVKRGRLNGSGVNQKDYLIF